MEGCSSLARTRLVDSTTTKQSMGGLLMSQLARILLTLVGVLVFIPIVLFSTAGVGRAAAGAGEPCGYAQDADVPVRQRIGTWVTGVDIGQVQRCADSLAGKLQAVERDTEAGAQQVKDQLAQLAAENKALRDPICQHLRDTRIPCN